MPAIPVLLVWAAAGAAGGYFFDRAGYAADRTMTLAKWGAVGVGAYYGAKALKIV
ncbi:hypothetical protein [Pyruvatibacter mobilis]|jgi:hypothetical protein|uniref:hypothetical protein n=1 Tax=Pyruvatibacter mobilis TaxID=1712261 RepID=UPI003BAD03F4